MKRLRLPHKWQLFIIKTISLAKKDSDQVEYEVLMKGAPEVLLKRCSTYSSSVDENFQSPVDDNFRERFASKNENFASHDGKRVLAVRSRRSYNCF